MSDFMDSDNVTEFTKRKRDAGRVWECNCGSILFMLTTAGIECSNCGDMQHSDEWTFENS